MEQNLLHNSGLQETVEADGRGSSVSAGLRCGGSPPWDQLMRSVACLDLPSSSWRNEILLSCPCHIPYSRVRRCCGVTRAAGDEHLWGCWTWRPWDWCPPYIGTLLLCPCQRGSQRCEAHPAAPSFCNEKVVLNSYVMKSGKICVAPLLAPEGLSGGMSSHGVTTISIPSPKSPRPKYCASVTSGLCFFTECRKSFAKRYVFELGQWLAGASPFNLAVTICLLPCDLTLKPELNTPSRPWLLSWEAWNSPLLTQRLGPSAAFALRELSPGQLRCTLTLWLLLRLSARASGLMPVRNSDHHALADRLLGANNSHLLVTRSGFEPVVCSWMANPQCLVVPFNLLDVNIHPTGFLGVDFSKLVG